MHWLVVASGKAYGLAIAFARGTNASSLLAIMMKVFALPELGVSVCDASHALVMSLMILVANFQPL
jgi:hypothetical protein